MLRRLLIAAPLLAQAVLAAPGMERRKTPLIPETSSIEPTVTSTYGPDATCTTSKKPIETPEAVNITLEARATYKRNVLYFTNWGIYGANFQPQQIPANEITHLLYAFANIQSDGTVVTSDSYADLEKHYSTDSWNDSGNNAYGCVKQLYILKQKYRGLKTLLSIGGWTYSSKFPPVAADATMRKTFAQSAVKLVTDWGFDGIDIDWEYPASATEANNFVLLLKEVRAAFDAYRSANGISYRFLMTVASPAGPTNYNTMKLKAMDAYLDAWHLMAYDFSGSWDTTVGHQANLYYDPDRPGATKFTADKAVSDYIAAGVPASKIVLGMPLYGRSFAKTMGLGKPFAGVGGGSAVGGTTTPGIYLFKDLPRPGAKQMLRDKPVIAVSYDSKTRELVSYDDLDSVALKAKYITGKGLGGSMFWEASGDKTGSASLVRRLSTSMGALDPTLNLLSYPKSAYDNIRSGKV